MIRYALTLLVVFSCATSPDPVVERMRGLSPGARHELDKYNQFLTARQIEHFVILPSDEDRMRFIADLHIEERLTKYPDHTREAIWRRDVIVGMDLEAVYLSWGKPDARDLLDRFQEGGNVEEIWRWARRDAEGRDGIARIRISNGIVVEVMPFEREE